jgi:hypothetical protein
MLEFLFCNRINPSKLFQPSKITIFDLVPPFAA